MSIYRANSGRHFKKSTIKEWALSHNFRYVEMFYNIGVVIPTQYNTFAGNYKTCIKFEKNRCLDDAWYAVDILHVNDLEYPPKFNDEVDFVRFDWNSAPLQKVMYDLEKFYNYIIKRLEKREKLRAKTQPKKIAAQKKLQISEIGLEAELNEIFNPVGLKVEKISDTKGGWYVTDKSLNLRQAASLNICGSGAGMTWFATKCKCKLDFYSKNYVEGYKIKFALPEMSNYNYMYAADTEAVIEAAKFYVQVAAYGRDAQQKAHLCFVPFQRFKDV